MTHEWNVRPGRRFYWEMATERVRGFAFGFSVTMKYGILDLWLVVPGLFLWRAQAFFATPDEFATMKEDAL